MEHLLALGEREREREREHRGREKGERGMWREEVEVAEVHSNSKSHFSSCSSPPALAAIDRYDPGPSTLPASSAAPSHLLLWPRIDHYDPEPLALFAGGVQQRRGDHVRVGKCEDDVPLVHLHMRKKENVCERASVRATERD